MKLLLLAFALLAPLRQEIRLDLFIPEVPATLFADYRNTNFEQRVEHTPEGARIRVQGHYYFPLTLRAPLTPDRDYLNRQPAAVRSVAKRLLTANVTLDGYIRSLRTYLRQHIVYSEEPLPQDPASVLGNRRAHCVGFSSLVEALLRSAGVNCRAVRGFYLAEGKDGRLEPISHRWLEVEARPDLRFFFDPQYQNFSSRYLLLAGETPFEQIERFSPRLLDKNVQWIDQ